MGTKRMSRTKKLKLRKNKKTRTQRRGQTQRRKRSSRRFKGGSIFPSSISNIGYSILGTGQSVMDGWNGKPSSYAYVNSSPESQSPINGIYQAHHNTI